MECLGIFLGVHWVSLVGNIFNWHTNVPVGRPGPYMLFARNWLHR